MITYVFCSEISDLIIWKHEWPYRSSLDTGISIWKICISSNRHQLGSFKSSLNADELQRASKYHFKEDWERFILSRGATKLILGYYTNQEPKSILIAQEKNKKSFLKNSNGIDIHFNISHSKDYILLGIGKHQLGVDIENIDVFFDYGCFFPSCFSKEEEKFIVNSINPAKNFYLLWTRKEALLKATGLGITDDLNYISCLEGENKVKGTIIESDKDWTIRTFQVSEDYIASIACCSNNPVSFFDFIYRPE